MRACAQVIAYEIAMAFALIGVFMMAGSLNITTIVMHQAGSALHWYWLPLFPLCVVYVIAAVAETIEPLLMWWKGSQKSWRASTSNIRAWVLHYFF